MAPTFLRALLKSALCVVPPSDPVHQNALPRLQAPLNAQYKRVFHTDYAAAQTQDPRALPLLLACLKDNQGWFDLPPNTHTSWLGALEIIWGAFGPQGVPDLVHALEKSTDPDELESAIFLLIWAHELNAAPRVREIAARGPRKARLEAIRYLGFYGRPQDCDFLVDGLRSLDPEEAPHFFPL